MVWFLIAECFAIWLNVLLVSERLFALNWPFLALRFANAKNAIALCILVLIFSVLLQVCKMKIDGNTLNEKPEYSISITLRSKMRPSEIF